MRNAIGYLMGFLMFVVGIPALMWWVSGTPALIPMDAFGHEVAPRTQNLMTDGPYSFNRNPMLTGTLTYLAGIVIWLWHWQAAVVWAAFLAIMLVQVLTEEKRLRKDFGEEYEDYCKKTRRF